MATDPNRLACAATRKDGQPCSVLALAGEAHCFAHSERTATLRAEARRMGGANSARNVRAQRLVPASLKPALALLFEALDEVHQGELDPRAAGAMAALAGTIARLYTAGVIEERVSALEQAQAGSGWRSG